MFPIRERTGQLRSQESAVSSVKYSDVAKRRVHSHFDAPVVIVLSLALHNKRSFEQSSSYLVALSAYEVTAQCLVTCAITSVFGGAQIEERTALEMLIKVTISLLCGAIANAHYDAIVWSTVPKYE